MKPESRAEAGLRERYLALLQTEYSGRIDNRLRVGIGLEAARERCRRIQEELRGQRRRTGILAGA
jgi:hypothetical protein